MKQILEAVYENGVFTPRKKPYVLNGQCVRIIIEIPSDTNGDILQLAADVYAGLSDEDIKEIEGIALDRTHFFAERRL